MTALLTAADERLDRLGDTLHEINRTLESLRVSLAAVAQTGRDHEERLRVVERWKHSLTPIIAVLTFLLGTVFTEMLKRLV